MSTTGVTDGGAAAPGGRHADRSVVSARRWDRILPRSVLGITALILSFSIGAALSGVVLYSYYQYKVDTTSGYLAKYVQGFDKRYSTALKTIEAETTNSKASIQKELEPLRQIQADGGSIARLTTRVAPAVWFVETMDEAGQPSVGSAFSVGSTSNQTLLVASYTTVRASTRSPGPQIFVRNNQSDRVKAELHTWDESKDLALLIITEGNQPKLDFAPSKPALQQGTQIFAASGLGSAGASISSGFVSDVFAQGIQHTADVGPQFQGGPLINADGKVVGIASRSYAPLGFVPDAVYFNPLIRAACEKVLDCPAEGEPSAGAAQ